MINQCTRRNGAARRPEWLGRQAGLTLVELMISLTLGLFVVLAATAMLVSSKTMYTSQDDRSIIQDTGRYAIEAISRATRQSAYENWDKESAPIIAEATMGANLAGLDANALKETEIGMDSPLGAAAAINGSDVLAVRFFGSGTGAQGDSTMLNCVGFGVPEPTSQNTAEEDRGWSIFYVTDTNGEPELRCKYYSSEKGTWNSEAIARGVESFQVLYGLDTDGDGLMNQYLTASEIDDLDSTLVLVGADEDAKQKDKNRKTNWKKITVVKVALLMRGSQPARSDTLTGQYDLFGKDYADDHAATDIGTRIKEADIPVAVRNRVRALFTSTIQIRNQLKGSGK